MNTRHLALLAALALSFANSLASAADLAAPARQTGVGPAIAQQGNAALQRIRADLGAALHRDAALPALPARVEIGRGDETAPASAPAVRAQLSL